MSEEPEGIPEEEIPEQVDPVEKEKPDEQVSQIQSPSQLDFNFTAYDQDIVITGAKGSGKSYLANVILKSLNGITVMAVSYTHLPLPTLYSV